MTLEFENESGTELGLPLEETARMVIEAALDELKCPYEAEVSLLITDNARIREMNRQFRQIDRPTDVLSFPMIQFDQPEISLFWKRKSRRNVLTRKPGNWYWEIL